MKRVFSLMIAAALLLSMTACGSTSTDGTEAPAAPLPTAAAASEKPVNLQELYDIMAADMPEMIVMNETMMLNFCGIAAEDCVQVIAAICGDGMRTDELWLIEAVDEGALERLKDLAETRLKMKGEETISYAPDQYAVVEKAQVITNDLYLALIVSPDVDALAKTCSDTIG